MNEISEAVDRYGELKAQESKLKKEVDSTNKKIKDYMMKGPETLEGNSYVATCKKYVNEDFDKEALIKVLKEHGMADGIVETKEVVNDEALENAVYNNKFPKDVLVEMSKCKVRKETYRLTIEKKKD